MNFRVLVVSLAFLLGLAVSGTLLPNGGAQPVGAAGFTGGDTTLAAAGTIALYPCFSQGGSHIHTGVFYTSANGCEACGSGYLYTSASAVRLKIFSSDAGVDSSGFTVPLGATFTGVPGCDSLVVLNTGGASTTVTWGFWR